MELFILDFLRMEEICLLIERNTQWFRTVS